MRAIESSVAPLALLLSCALLALASSTDVNAAPIQNPGNGHYYELVSEYISWTDAKAAASSRQYLGMQGYLATVTSQAENDWILANILPQGTYITGVWIGGAQDSTGVEPAGGWHWDVCTGEPFSYTNWEIGPEPSPDNAGGCENLLEMHEGTGRWGDVGDVVPGGLTQTAGYVVEYGGTVTPGPCPTDARVACGSSLPPPVVVTASPLWTNTGQDVGAGQCIGITASGTWSYGGASCGPDGDLAGGDHSDDFEHFDASDKARLIAYIGTDPFQGHWGDRTFFPHSSGYVSVGSSASFLAKASGRLWLGINDDAVSQSVGDNSGSLTATITVVQCGGVGGNGGRGGGAGKPYYFPARAGDAGGGDLHGMNALDPIAAVSHGRLQYTLRIRTSANVTLRLYDVAGRQVSELFRGRLEAGEYRRTWFDPALRTGAYVLRMTDGRASQTRPVIVLR